MSEPIAEKDAGIERRYHVAKTNDPTGKHDDCQYFVLDPQHDPFAVAALRAYAAQVGGELAEDIARWLRALGYCPNCSQVDGHRGSCATSADDPDPWRCTVCGSGREVHIVGERDGSVTHAWEPHLAQTGEAPMPDAERDAGLVTWTMPREDALDLLAWLRHNRPLGMPDRTFDGLLDALTPASEPNPAPGRVDGVRLGSRVLHQIAGRTTKGNAMTVCGRTIDRTDPRYQEVAAEAVPVGRHCLGCWG